ncbi:MAG TPA: DUF5989 family protein [Phycisphaerales bacterium]|nr:DUF5989 family protein [Phycisphaerales bacterium]
MTPMTTSQPLKSDSFAQQAAQKRASLFAELWDFLKNNKKWWLIPMILVLVLVGVLVVLGGTAAAPFIYTLF